MLGAHLTTAVDRLLTQIKLSKMVCASTFTKQFLYV